MLIGTMSFIAFEDLNKTSDATHGAEWYEFVKLDTDRNQLTKCNFCRKTDILCVSHKSMHVCESCINLVSVRRFFTRGHSDVIINLVTKGLLHNAN